MYENFINECKECKTVNAYGEKYCMICGEELTNYLLVLKERLPIIQINERDYMDDYPEIVKTLDEWINELDTEDNYNDEEQIVYTFDDSVKFRTNFENDKEISINGFCRLKTIGDGSCLIHSIFLALCQSYRNIDSNRHRSYIVQKFRLESYADITKYNKEYVKDLKNFLHADTHANELANRLKIAIMMFKHTKQQFIDCNNNRNNYFENIIEIFGNYKSNTLVIFIYGDGIHYEAMSYKNLTIMSVLEILESDDIFIKENIGPMFRIK